MDVSKKIQGHIVPLLINLTDRTYHLVDPTRTLWGQKLWFSDGILCGNFTETYWTRENLQQREIKMKFLNGFNDLKSFFDLDIAKLPVKLVKWEDGIQISWIE